MKAKRPDIERLYEHELHVYFKYESLDASELVEILSNLDRLYKKVLGISSPVYIHDDRAFRNFMEITSINTGESINFKLKEGWRPEFKIESGDLNVYCPKNLGIPALIFLLILTSIQNSLNIYNTYQDMELKKIERQIKEIELYQKLEEKRRMKGSRAINMQVNKTVKYFIENQRITYVEINGIEIPKSKRKWGQVYYKMGSSLLLTHGR
jgi:hypothetical protein